jgi:hypothetical protein
VVGATLEIAAYRLLLDHALPDDVPPAHEALLVLHAGEVGRSQALLSEILADEPALDALQARIVAENLAFLESNAPSSRVRACDWLAGRGRAPAGYDPLAPREERRAALATAVTAAPP